ncbi:MAG: mannose-1-phosphate guanylyltransferase [Bacteroidaceae bacterium]|nr:mannose-1-phosphate guanylyltransferase [Bacteroidaceae bacterium]MBQ6695035.1 mannose-1-phosphate guanylyltransferase [Bacteroidaceae bacterium]MBR7167173.1 mannose-1-phosphate guanylyltransferase [Bacteroidaceae bacterium]
MDKNRYCVIMAGGIGSRLWPLSRKERPKQFHDLLGCGKTLLQQTYHRYSRIVPCENIIVSTNIEYSSLVREQLPELPADQILHEPTFRGTAPSIAYAACHIRQLNPMASIVVAQSDQLVLNENSFVETVGKGLDFVAQQNKLVIIGIKPTCPETRYGYIQVEDKHSASDDGIFYKARTFTEKPTYEFAKIFMDSGEFFWNSGIYIWSVQTIIETLSKLLPDMMAKFEQVFRELPNRDDRRRKIYESYTSFPNVSIDSAVMERADNVFVEVGEFGWADIGTWDSLYGTLPKDSNGNVVLHSHTMMYDSRDNVIALPKGKLAVIQDVEGLLIVDAGNVLMVCRKGSEGDIRKFLNDARMKLGEEFA